MFTWLALAAALGVAAYVFMKTDGFVTSVSCALVLGAIAYGAALCVGAMVSQILPYEWRQVDSNLVALYRGDNAKEMYLDVVAMNGSDCICFRRLAEVGGTGNHREALPISGRVLVRESNNEIEAILRTHRFGYIRWGWYLSWLALDEPDKYEFIVPAGSYPKDRLSSGG